MELFDKMLQREKEDFRRISNRLLSTCFLCRANETSKSDYYFVLKYKNEFKTYLDVLGYRLEVNEELGVIQLVNAYNYNRMNLKLYESIILLILRILYDEKKRELSISDKMIDKTTMRNALSVFRRFQLIEILDRDLANEESRILIYDSILMAVQIDDIKKACEKVEIYRKGRQTDEEADENEAD